MTDVLTGALLAAWLLLEVVLRDGDDARSWKGGAGDRSSTRLVVVTYLVAFVAPFVLGTSGVGAVPADSTVAWMGVSIGAIGLGLRIWSMRVLGRDYTRSLRTRETQVVVARGPYRVVRHPGYAGSVLTWFGSRLAVNWLVGAATLLALVLVYVYRIDAEERMLTEHLGEPYAAYRLNTWRLLPFVW